MRDNPPPAQASDFALPGHRVIVLEGRDAVAFAHAQFMNDVKLLGTGQWQWNGWLTPKGRLIALFALLKSSDERIGLLLPDHDPDALAAALRLYQFRSKLLITVRDDLHAVGGFRIPGEAHGNSVAGDLESAAELDMGGDGGPRTLRIVANSEAAADAGALARWTTVDLEHGLPRLPPSQSGQWTPQMLSLDRLRAFSIKKGCYPGQEIVARTHFLGQAKRGLALFDTAGPVAAGDEVRDAERALGTVVSAVGALALAVLPLEREPGPLHVHGAALQERPLLGGLER